MLSWMSKILRQLVGGPATPRQWQTASRQTFGADRHQTDAFALDKLQRLVDVGQFVDAHLSAIRLRQLLAGDDLEQQHQLEPVAKVLLDRLDLRAGLA